MRKTINRIITILMSICMLQTVISPVAFAEKETIWEVLVEYYAPEEGDEIYTNPFVYANGCDCDLYYSYDNFMESVRAYDITAKRYMTEGDKVIAGHQYKIEILVKPDNGYQFSDYNGKPNVDATIRSHRVVTENLKPEVYWYDSKSIILSYVYTVNKKETIENIEIVVTPPREGEYPDFTYDILTDNVNINTNHDDGEYIINGIQWGVAPVEGSPTSPAQPLHKDLTFQGGVRYRLVMDIVAIQDYAQGIDRVFDFENSSEMRNFDVLVNEGGSYTKKGKYSPDDTFDSYNCMRIYRDFVCPYRNKVESVSVEVEPPMVGNKPDFTPLMGAENYKIVENPDDVGFINGIKWHNNTTGENLTEDDCFEKDNSYSFCAYLEPSDMETIFTTDNIGDTTVTGKLNGNEADVSNGTVVNSNSAHAISFEYRFDKLSNILPRVAVLSIDKPAAGEKPDFNGSVVNEKLYYFNKDNDNNSSYINGIQWWDDTEGRFLDKEETFKAGNYYQIYVDVSISDKYDIDNTTTFAINDAEGVTALMIAGTKDVRLICNFGEVEPYKTEANIVTDLDMPKEGECPDYTLTLENDQCRVESVKWYDVSTMVPVELSKDEEFIGGHTYKVELELSPAENYVFSTTENGDLTYELGLKYVNGSFTHIFDFVVDGDKNGITATHTFDAPRIKNVDVSIDEPAVGFTPSYIAYPSNDACSANYVAWYDKTDGVYIDEYSEFIEGHVYVVEVDLFTVGRATFDFEDLFAATINSKEAKTDSVFYKMENSNVGILWDRFYAVRVSYEFEPCKEEIVLNLEYDRYTNQVGYGYTLPAKELDYMENYLCILAFYDNSGALIKAIPKKPNRDMGVSDAYFEAIPDKAKDCKVMLIDKTTLEPKCESLYMEIPEPDPSYGI